MLVCAAACKGDAKAPPKLAERVPVVTSAEVLLGEDQRVPPILVLVNADGTVAVADAPKGGDGWAVLNRKAPKNNGVALDLSVLGPTVREAAALGTDIEPRARDMKGGKHDDLQDLAVLDEGALAEDPPPPEPEEEGEDDDSGGTGTAMALEEGKMGKKDSDRATGQYRMKNNNDDPQLARQQAIDQARSAGILGTVSAQQGGAFASLTGTGDLSAGFDDTTGFGPGGGDSAMPHRLGVITGHRLDESDRQADALIVAAPTAKATAILKVLAEVGRALVAVQHQGKLRALRIGFGIRRSGDPFAYGLADESRWVEVRVGAAELTVEAVPSPPVVQPWAQGPLDAAALDKAYDAAVAALGDADRSDVDILIGPDTDLQRLVDVLAALDAAGATSVAIGMIPDAGSPEATKRGKSIVRTMIGQPAAVGDLDKAIIRRYVKRAIPKITYCYEKELLANAGLSGTVQTQFFISPDGTVTDARATGVSDAVASCVADVIKAIEFPKPKGGGGVQVNYPFTFRST